MSYLKKNLFKIKLFVLLIHFFVINTLISIDANSINFFNEVKELIVAETVRYSLEDATKELDNMRKKINDAVINGINEIEKKTIKNNEELNKSDLNNDNSFGIKSIIDFIIENYKQLILFSEN